MMSVDVSKINYAAVGAGIAKYLKAAGMQEQAKSSFPGLQLGFSSGDWTLGYGDDAKKLKRGTRVIMNVPNCMLTWNKWVDYTNKEGDTKRRPHFEPVCHPAKGEDMTERAALGDNDTKLWEKDKKSGRSMEPWKPTCVFPIRSTKDGDETINHMLLSGPSAFRTGVAFFGKVMQEMAMHPGQLPVVTLDSETAEMGKGEDKVKWQVPVFEVVDWVDAIAADFPGEGGVQVLDESEHVDVGVVKSVTKSNTSQAGAAAEKKAETEKKPSNKKPEASAKPEAAAKPKRKVVIDGEDDEGEDF
jgi:hypothetical protein